MVVEKRFFIHSRNSLGGGLKIFLFSPLFWEDFQFDYIMCFKEIETTNRFNIAPENQWLEDVISF